MPVELLSGCLRYRRAIVSGALGSVIAASWAYLWLGGGQIMPMPPEWSVPYAALIFVMWAVMMVAMMLPGAAPTGCWSPPLRRIAPPIPSSFPPPR